jgi:hypothetical protein
MCRTPSGRHILAEAEAIPTQRRFHKRSHRAFSPSCSCSIDYPVILKANWFLLITSAKLIFLGVNTCRGRSMSALGGFWFKGGFCQDALLQRL